MKTDYRISHQSAEISKTYDEVLYRKGSYDDTLWQEEQRILDREVIFLRAEISHISYLDFACGTGRILSFLETKVDDATGVDVAHAMLERARGVVRKAQLVQADLTRSDVLQGNTYDLITAFRFFLNAELSLREEAMALLSKKLRNENSVLLFNMHGNVWSHRVFTKLWLRFRGKHLSAATRREVIALAERHGLQVVRWYGFGVVPKVLYRIIGSTFVYDLDRILSYIPGARYISYDLIFICGQKVVEPKTSLW